MRPWLWPVHRAGCGQAFGVVLALGILILPAPARARVVPRTARKVFVPVLIYHHVKWLKPSDNAIERGLTVLPSQFKAELNWLRAHHYHTVTASQIAAFLRGGPALPFRPVAITFDDGYTDMAAYAYPMLRYLGLRATYFVVPGFLDTPRYLRWSQVQSMARHGMDIEAHTMTHPDLTVVPPGQQWGEIDGSRRVLQERLHRTVRVFAYPYGSYNAAIIHDVARAGYWAAFTTHQGWTQRSNQSLTLPRVYVDLDDTLAIFAGRLRADPSILAQDPT